MKKKIFIMHHSEIVRKGLASILQNNFNIEVIQLWDMEEIRGYKHIADNRLILFCEADIFSKKDLVDLFGKKNELLTIGIANEPFHTSRYDFFITLQTGSIEICERIKKQLNLKDKPARHPEGKELTKREKEVLKLVASGFSNKIIAEDLFISTHTVISHRKKITEKTGIKSISGLTVYAILNNLIDTENMNPEDFI